tara:strand:+ start:304 stop:891 length:588 start_codon:yes stop_codon:yes gene_type:complete
MIKVNYDTETTLVKGYYPDLINYALIPEPFIEIENSAQVLDKQMCVVNGVYQEYVTPDNVLLEQGKQTKIAQLKTERNRLLLGAQTYTITVSDISCSFSLSNADLPNLIARQSSLGSPSETFGWNDINNNRIELNKATFLSLIRHININDIGVWDLYTAKLNEINAISIDGEYFDENQEPISALQALENININLI